MKHRSLALAISLAILTAVAVNQNAAAQADARSQERIAREVRHELLMLPWFGAFDYIAFKVDGGTVTLMGQEACCRMAPAMTGPRIGPIRIGTAA